MGIYHTSLAFFRRTYSRFKELFERRTDVHYTSVPYWRPWRDF
jgi:hypothetical protein